MDLTDDKTGLVTISWMGYTTLFLDVNPPGGKSYSLRVIMMSYWPLRQGSCGLLRLMSLAILMLLIRLGLYVCLAVLLLTLDA